MPRVARIYQIENPNKHPKFAYLSFIKRGISSTKSTLGYMKMKKVPVTTQQIAAMFPNFFRTAGDASRIVHTLERHGLASKTIDNHWVITPLGISSCYALGSRDAIVAALMV